MSSGETLLKITDFPFSYSSIAIILGIMNINFIPSHIVEFIGVAGAFGTFLSITDPLGRLLKFSMKQDIDKFIKKVRSDSGLVITLRSAKEGIETRAIGIEIDKFVSVGYFVIILLMYNTLFVYSATFSENLVLKDKDGKIICDFNCIRTYGNIISFLAIIVVIVIVTINWKKLKKNVITAGIHQIGISSTDVTRSTIENMTRAIEQNDWPTADKWGAVVEKEIETQKGNKDTLLKLADTIYQPLYQELYAMESAVISQHIKNFIPFPSTSWDQVRQNPLFLTFVDDELRKELGLFYEKILEYNSLDSITRSAAEQIIRHRINDVYESGDMEIFYFVRTPQGQISAPALWDCLLSETHPKERLGSPSIPQYIQVQSHSQNTSENRDTQSDFNQFDTLWSIIVRDSNNNKDILRRRNLFNEIIERNPSLKTKIFERIQYAFKA